MARAVCTPCPISLRVIDSLYGNVAMWVGNLPVRPPEAGHEGMALRATEWIVAKVARELGLNVTGGSTSVADAWDVLPLAAASARAQLVNAAALSWKLPAAGCRLPI